jgi:hypothetical protein
MLTATSNRQEESFAGKRTCSEIRDPGSEFRLQKPVILSPEA